MISQHPDLEGTEHDGRPAAREHFETVIVGGGQAGLAVGYHLQKRGRPFVILDAYERIGDSWRTRRWDSLRLFTPAGHDGLPGWSFPAASWSFPTKDQMADYLEAYARRFELPVRTRVTVDGLSRRGTASSSGQETRGSRPTTSWSRQVPIAVPTVPDLARELDPRIVQMHSSEYRDPSQLHEGDVLVVGAGNSGADIALEASRSHRIWLSGRDKGQIPFRIETTRMRLLFPVLWFVASRVLTVKTPVGRKLRPHALENGAPLIRVKPEDLAAAGVERVPKVGRCPRRVARARRRTRAGGLECDLVHRFPA